MAHQSAHKGAMKIAYTALALAEKTQELLLIEPSNPKRLRETVERLGREVRVIDMAPLSTEYERLWAAVQAGEVDGDRESWLGSVGKLIQAFRHLRNLVTGTTKPNQEEEEGWSRAQKALARARRVQARHLTSGLRTMPDRASLVSEAVLQPVSRAADGSSGAVSEQAPSLQDSAPTPAESGDDGE